MTEHTPIAVCDLQLFTAPASIGQVTVSPATEMWTTRSVVPARPRTKGLLCRYNLLFRYANVTSTVKKPLLQEESEPKKTKDIFSTPLSRACSM